MTSALEGIKILDLSRLLPFEYCTMILGDLGAEVLKIEEPKIGDYMRFSKTIFSLLNRNKKSMELNLKSDRGRDILCKLVKEYDVLFESFRPGVMSSFGLDYAKLKLINPKLIYCSSTGYGQDGPYKHKPGHDINYLSISGILGETGRHTGAPVIPGIPVADMTAGVYSALAILAALIARDKTGKGQYIDVSMTDCMVSYNLINLVSCITGSKKATLDFANGSPFYNVYETKDRKYISIGNIEGKFWINFCKVIKREDLIKKQLATGDDREKLVEELRKIFLKKSRDEWLDLMEGKDICVAPVNSIEEVLKDPHLNHRNMFPEVDHDGQKIKYIALPIKFSETPYEIRSKSPSLGEHTDKVLKDLGYVKDVIKKPKQ